MAMTISELANGAGVGVETVRFYQRRGLVDDPRPSRSGGAPGRRHYGEDDLRRLRFVRSAQRAGFTLDEIARLIELDRDNDRATARTMARERIAALDARIAELEASRDALARLERDCVSGTQGPCPILAAFDGA
ncbi:MAG: MerR family DNA-binding protein [Novosphingobium sp.]|nr:MerR family DNA-binding protein [Novosphingobium sp.]